MQLTLDMLQVPYVDKRVVKEEHYKCSKGEAHH
jgi:hypothetical protein